MWYNVYSKLRRERLWWNGSEVHLDYGTEITDDVIGYLDEGKVEELLDRIKNL